MNWYLEAFQKYAVFSGRARRKEYWYFILFNTIAQIIFATLDNVTGTFDPETGMGILGGIYTLVALIPGISVSVRRLHDTERSGWWLLIPLIPLIGAIVLIVFMVTDSNSKENRYGTNPKLDTA